MKTRIVCKNTNESRKVRERLTEALNKAGISLNEKEPDVIITIGGDGTMLGAIKEFHDDDIPFIGVNMGNLGFLMNESGEELDQLAEKLANREYQVYQYPLYQAEVSDLQGSCYTRNFFADLIIERAEMNLTEMEVYVNNEPLNYFAGDGFIVATPMGSTAYAVWAGGSAIHNSLSCLELVPLHPNDSARNLPLKVPLVLPGDTELFFKIRIPHLRSVRVAADGYEIRFKSPVVSARVSPSNRKVTFWKFAEYDYMRRVKEKIIDKDNVRKIEC